MGLFGIVDAISQWISPKQPTGRIERYLNKPKPLIDSRSCQHNYVNLVEIPRVKYNEPFDRLFIKGCTNCKNVKIYNPVDRSYVSPSDSGLSINDIRILQSQIPNDG